MYFTAVLHRFTLHIQLFDCDLAGETSEEEADRPGTAAKCLAFRRSLLQLRGCLVEVRRLGWRFQDKSSGGQSGVGYKEATLLLQVGEI